MLQKCLRFEYLTKNRKKILQFTQGVLFSCIILGCSSQAPSNNALSAQKTTPQWLAQEAKLKQIRHFELRGKMAFRGPKQMIGANFVWRQQGESLSLRLTSFLGSTLLKLDSTPISTSIIDNNGKRYQGKDLSKLINALTGVDLPVTQLSNWLKALPEKSNSFLLNSKNTLSYLSQFKAPNQKRGWQLTYSSYANYKNILLPNKITMNNQNQQVDLYISRWLTKK